MELSLFSKTVSEIGCVRGLAVENSSDIRVNHDQSIIVTFVMKVSVVILEQDILFIYKGTFTNDAVS